MSRAMYTTGMQLQSHTLTAHNDAAASANKIHDDTVARQYGFRGGLVPGISVYAYMTYPLVHSFGEAWLTRGTAQVQFAKPIYAGDQVTVTGTVNAVTESEMRFDLASTNAPGPTGAHKLGSCSRWPAATSAGPHGHSAGQRGVLPHPYR